jgi:hypothetical protein
MPWRWKWLGYVAMLTHVMKELIAYESWHEVMWLGGEDQDKPWFDRPVVSVKGKLEAFKRQTARGREAWAMTWRWWTKAMMKSKWSCDRWTNKVTRWYKVDHIICDDYWCLCSINIRGDEMECVRQRYICMAFHFTGQRLCREVHNQIYDRWSYYQ